MSSRKSHPAGSAKGIERISHLFLSGQQSASIGSTHHQPAARLICGDTNDSNARSVTVSAVITDHLGADADRWLQAVMRYWAGRCGRPLILSVDRNGATLLELKPSSGGRESAGSVSAWSDDSSFLQLLRQRARDSGGLLLVSPDWWRPGALEVLCGCGEIIIACGHEQHDLLQAYRVIKTLLERGCGGRMGVLMLPEDGGNGRGNGPATAAGRAFDKLSAAVEKFLAVKLRYAGQLPSLATLATRILANRTSLSDASPAGDDLLQRLSECLSELQQEPLRPRFERTTRAERFDEPAATMGCGGDSAEQAEFTSLDPLMRGNRRASAVSASGSAATPCSCDVAEQSRLFPLQAPVQTNQQLLQWLGEHAEQIWPGARLVSYVPPESTAGPCRLLCAGDGQAGIVIAAIEDHRRALCSLLLARQWFQQHKQLLNGFGGLRCGDGRTPALIVFVRGWDRAMLSGVSVLDVRVKLFRFAQLSHDGQLFALVEALPL